MDDELWCGPDKPVNAVPPGLRLDRAILGTTLLLIATAALTCCMCYYTTARMTADTHFDVLNPSAERIAQYIIDTIVHEALPEDARRRIDVGRAVVDHDQLHVETSGDLLE